MSERESERSRERESERARERESERASELVTVCMDEHHYVSSHQLLAAVLSL